MLVVKHKWSPRVRLKNICHKSARLKGLILTHDIHTHTSLGSIIIVFHVKFKIVHYISLNCKLDFFNGQDHFQSLLSYSSLRILICKIPLTVRFFVMNHKPPITITQCQEFIILLYMLQNSSIHHIIVDDDNNNLETLSINVKLFFRGQTA